MTAPRRLEGKRCIVTGGSRGLGLAIGLAFVRHGARLCFTYSTNDDDAADAERLLREAGADDSRLMVRKGSVTDVTHARDTVAAVARAWGGLDVLVNNAGVTQVLPISLLEESDWDLVMDTNVKGAYLFSRAALRTMIRQRAGHILNVGNFASERVIEAPVHYAAAKAALRGLTEALAREVGRHGVQVNLIAPGMLDVGMAQGLPQHRQREYLDQAALGRFGRAAEIAEAAAFLVSDENRFMSGGKLVIDGGI